MRISCCLYPVECAKYFPNQLANTPQRVIDKSDQELEAYMKAEGRVEFWALFTFLRLGRFEINMTGINRVSSESVLFPVDVTKGPCFNPLLLVAAMNPCFLDSMCIDGERVSQHLYPCLLKLESLIYGQVSSPSLALLKIWSCLPLQRHKFTELLKGFFTETIVHVLIIAHPKYKEYIRTSIFITAKIRMVMVN